MRVQRDQEQVLSLDSLQQASRLAGADDRVAERAAEPVQQRCMQEEAPHLLGLIAQDLARQVIDDVAVVPREGFDELAAVRLSPQREPGQVEACRPTLGALVKA